MKMRLVIIGGGNMGWAILRALLKSASVPPEDILLIESDGEKRQKISYASNCNIQTEVDEAIRGYDVVLLAVKPQNSTAVMEMLAQWLLPEHVVVSIMAGISMHTMHRALEKSKLVRVMPNIPALIGEGMSVFFASDEVKNEEREWVRILFNSCGSCLEAKNEDAIDAATAISGSGPGYLFYLAEQMVSSANALGFNEEEAQILVQKTFRGATLLWESQQVTPETLKQQVSSPGGTTLAALNHFQSKNVGESIKEGMSKAYRRAKELSS